MSNRINNQSEESFKAITSERNYQDSLMKIHSCWNGSEPSVGEEILMLELYVKKAREAWVSDWGNRNAGLNELRKCAGICVRAMDNHGAPRR
jgi:hypothetical protein